MKILVADDHPLVRDALARTVASLDAQVQVFEASDCAELRTLAAEHDLDLALVDLNMPGMHGISGLRTLRSEFPTLVLIVASAQDDVTTIRNVLSTGVSGFIPKTESRDVVLQAIRLVQAGGVYVPAQVLGGAGASATASGAWSSHASGNGNGSDTGLTPRQFDVLACLLQGRPNKLIARDLGLTEGTVKIHIAAILRTLGASNRTEAVIRARELGLLRN
ncbi:MAG: response regulator transcription factor [Caldimonas sp.]